MIKTNSDDASEHYFENPNDSSSLLPFSKNSSSEFENEKGEKTWSGPSTVHITETQLPERELKIYIKKIY